jgi:pimeloyl-ACP methyl ester carboxylesterase
MVWAGHPPRCLRWCAPRSPAGWTNYCSVRHSRRAPAAARRSWGAHDQGHQRAIAQHLVFHLPNAQLAIVDDAAHLINLEQPEVFARLLLDFLSDLR